MKESSRWLYIVLFLSMAANIFIIGYFIGHNPNKADMSLNMPMAQEFKGVFNELSIENRKQIAGLMKKQQQEIMQNKVVLRQLRLQIAQVLLQEPLDQQKLAALFTQVSDLTSKNIALGQQTMYQALILLPQSERIKVGKMLANPPKRQRPNPNTLTSDTPDV